MIENPTAVAVFAAGVLTILTPCCLPMVPVLVVGSSGHPLRPVAIVTGSTLTFTALGVVTGMIGWLTPNSLRVPFAVLMLAFGAVMADEDLNDIYSRYASRIAGRASVASGRIDEDRHPLLNAFAIGLLLGIIWLPCVGPILGGVLAYVGSTSTVARSAGLLFVYGAGFSVPLLVVAYAGKQSGRRLFDPVVDGVPGDAVRTLTGYAFVALGIAVLFDIDKLLLASVTDLV